jgi:cobalt/nickel transport protein
MKRSTLVNWLLLFAVLVLVALPLLFVKGEYGGSDGLAQQTIAADHPDYRPWFSSLYEPPSGEIASGLFALQAAIGAGFIGYYFGVARTKRRLADGVAPTSGALPPEPPADDGR